METPWTQLQTAMESGLRSEMQGQIQTEVNLGTQARSEVTDGLDELHGMSNTQG
jgi:hypothetical protein